MITRAKQNSKKTYSLSRKFDNDFPSEYRELQKRTLCITPDTYAVLLNLFDLEFAEESRYPRIQKPISRFQAFHFE